MLDYRFGKEYIYAFSNILNFKVMATHKGPFDFDGSMGGFRSYYDPSTGKRIDGETGGPTSDEFWNNPNYLPAQKRAIELGGRSKWASLIKLGLFDIRHLMHSRAFNNIVAVGRPIQAQDETADIGFRGIAVNRDPGALLEIDFNKDLPFASVIREIYQIAFSADNKTVTLTIPSFVPTRDIRRVTKYVAVRFFLNISQVSAVVWNPETKKYEPVVSDLELISKCTIGEWIAKTDASGEIVLEASFDEPAFSVPGTTVLVSMGIEFATSMKQGQPYVLPQSGTMAIVGYFTE
jgi:hypothetical protein